MTRDAFFGGGYSSRARLRLIWWLKLNHAARINCNSEDEPPMNCQISSSSAINLTSYFYDSLSNEKINFNCRINFIHHQRMCLMLGPHKQTVKLGHRGRIMHCQVLCWRPCVSHQMRSYGTVKSGQIRLDREGRDLCLFGGDISAMGDILGFTTGLQYKAVPRFGGFCSCCCLPLLP